MGGLTYSRDWGNSFTQWNKALAKGKITEWKIKIEQDFSRDDCLKKSRRREHLVEGNSFLSFFGNCFRFSKVNIYISDLREYFLVLGDHIIIHILSFYPFKYTNSV